MKLAKQEYDANVKVTDLVEHPDNPRQGDDAAVDESVAQNGFYGAIVAQRSTSRVLAGHTRLRVAKKAKAKTVPVFWIDVDDQTARRILLADNRTADLAIYDDEMLMKLLASTLEETGQLTGTGYDDGLYTMLLSQQFADDGEVLGNFREGPEVVDRVESSSESYLRSIILPYPIEDYEVMLGAFAELRNKLGIETNAGLVQHLVAEATKGG